MPAARSVGSLLSDLAGLSYREAARTRRVTRGTSICGVGTRIEEIFFPIDVVISSQVTMLDGRVAEVALIGCFEAGGAGAVSSEGDFISPFEMTVQASGEMLVLPVEVAREEFLRNDPYRRLFMKVAQAMIIQISQSAACSSLHSAEARYARRLLECGDRIGVDEFELTHETLAQMLGVRRATVTEVAGSLAAAGIIEMRRGVTRIVDRSMLRVRACECYALLRDEYARLLGAVYQAKS